MSNRFNFGWLQSVNDEVKTMRDGEKPSAPADIEVGRFFYTRLTNNKTALENLTD